MIIQSFGRLEPISACLETFSLAQLSPLPFFSYTTQQVQCVLLLLMIIRKVVVKAATNRKKNYS